MAEELFLWLSSRSFLWCIRLFWNCAALPRTSPVCFLLPHYCSFLYHPFSLCRIIGISPMLWILSKNLIIFSHKIWILHWPYLWLNYLARSFGIHLEVPWIFIPKFSISGCYFWSQRIFLFPFPIYSSLNLQ